MNARAGAAVAPVDFPRSDGRQGSNRSGSEVECEFQLGTALIRQRLWVGICVLVKSQVSQHGRDGVRVVDFGHNAKFTFALHDATRVVASNPRELFQLCAYGARGAIASSRSIEIGIGLHTGQVSFGNVGTEKRLASTVVGGPVNSASRVEALCRSLRKPLLMTEAFANLVCKIFLSLSGTPCVQRGL